MGAGMKDGRSDIDIDEMLSAYRDAFVDEYGTLHGWRSALARQAGCHRSYIACLARGTRALGNGSKLFKRLEKAVEDGPDPHCVRGQGPAAMNELGAMGKIAEMVEALEPSEQARIAAWVGAKWGQE